MESSSSVRPDGPWLGSNITRANTNDFAPEYTERTGDSSSPPIPGTPPENTLGGGPEVMPRIPSAPKPVSSAANPTSTQVLGLALTSGGTSFNSMRSRAETIVDPEERNRTIEAFRLIEAILATMAHPRHWLYLDPDVLTVFGVSNSSTARYVIAPEGMFSVRSSRRDKSLQLAEDLAREHEAQVADFQPVTASFNLNGHDGLSKKAHPAVRHGGYVVVLLEDSGLPTSVGGLDTLEKRLKPAVRQQVMSMAKMPTTQ